MTSHSSASASKRRLEQLAELLGVFEQPFLLDHFERGDAGPGGDRIAAERGRVHAGPQAGAISGLASSAPPAMPPQRALASVITSGVTPKC